MTDKARQYKPSTIRRLDTLSGNQCANPDCDRQLIAHDGETIISKICHIKAASAKGPRFNLNMTDDDRRHYNNLILLCDECHSVIDNKSNEDKYPVALLQEWKSNHTTLIQSNIFKRKPSLLSLAINAIADLDFKSKENEIDKQINAFNISDKIEFNSLKRNKPLIKDYSQFYGKINALYGELEDAGSFKKEKILRNIRQIYVRVKGQYLIDATDELQIIQINADNIFDDVEEKLLSLIDENQSSSKEDISFALPIIMVDAFMRCKILEEPPK